MKAILEFNLEERDDSLAHLRCVKSLNMALVLWEIDQHLRGLIKHAPDSQSDETHEQIKQIRSKLHEEMNDRGIILDELID